MSYFNCPLKISILLCILTLGSIYFTSPAYSENTNFNDLLIKYRPHLFATKKEFSPPLAVESMLENSYLVDTDKSEVIVSDDGEPIIPTIEILKQYNEKKYSIKLFKDYTRLYGDSNEANYSGTTPVVYARATKDEENHLIALQYFFFYAGSFTGKMIIGLQLGWHEGDTEYAQILLDSDTLKPVGASTSIHYYGSSKPWDELIKGNDGRIHMYSAQHSHATYLAPSKWPGHQAMVGNLGFGGNLITSLKTVWDYCSEDQEVNYELQIPGEDHPVFTWKGHWGGREKLLPSDDSRKSREPGPVSFAYRNAMSKSLSMWHNPGFFHFFYYMPTNFYTKLLISLKEVEEDSIKEQMFDMIYRIGRLRSKVDLTLATNYKDLSNWQKGLLAEATPFVVLSMTNEKVTSIYSAGVEKLGGNIFKNLMKSIAVESVEDIEDSLDGQKLPEEIESNPLNLYLLPPSKLLNLLATLTGLEPHTIVEIYKSSHSMRNDDLSVFTDFDELHIVGN